MTRCMHALHRLFALTESSMKLALAVVFSECLAQGSSWKLVQEKVLYIIEAGLDGSIRVHSPVLCPDPSQEVRVVKLGMANLDWANCARPAAATLGGSPRLWMWATMASASLGNTLSSTPSVAITTTSPFLTLSSNSCTIWKISTCYPGVFHGFSKSKGSNSMPTLYCEIHLLMYQFSLPVLIG